METEFNENYLEVALKELSREQKILFMLSCCERLYPNYVAFYREHKWGNPIILRDILNFIWTLFDGGYENTENIKTLFKQCDEITPDTEDFDSVYVSPALDSAVSVAQLLEFIISDSIEKTIEVASLSYDTVDMYIQELEDMTPDDPNLEKKILNRRLIQQELKRQRKDIELLKNVNVSDVTEFKAIKKKWYRTTTSNIELTCTM